MQTHSMSRGLHIASAGTKDCPARQPLILRGHWTAPAPQAARLRRAARPCSCSATSSGSATREATRDDEAVRQEVFDVIASARNKAQPRPAANASKDESGPLADFARKCKAAFHIFFPPRPKTLTPKEEGRNRLRMILVADRCAMNANSLVEMKTSIVNAVANYVEIEQEEAVEVSMTTDPDLGTIYSVAVPVKRVLPTARAGLADDVAEQGVTSVEWEAEQWDADPAARFPWGT